MNYKMPIVSKKLLLCWLLSIIWLLSYGFAINIMPDLNNAMQVIWTVVGTPNGEQPDWSNEYFMFWSTWWYIIWNVGLGTKVPWPYKLFVQWDTNIEWKLTTNDLEIENNLHVQWNLSASGATTLWWPLWVYGPTKIDGRVGIWVNTLSTYYKLEVNGPTNIQWDLFAPNINASANVNVSWDVKIDNDAYWRDAYFRNLNANGGVNVSGDVRVNTDVYGRDAYFRNLFASGWFFSGLVADTITWWNWFFSGLSVGNLVVSWSFTLPPGDEDQVLMTKNWEADRHTLPLDLTWASGQTLRRVDGKWTKSSVLQNLWNKVLITTDAEVRWAITIWNRIGSWSNQPGTCNATEQWTVLYDWACFRWCNGDGWTTIWTCSCGVGEYYEPNMWCLPANPQNAACISYPTPQSSQPANTTLSWCLSGTYLDISDTYDKRQRQCVWIQWWSNATCSANKDARCGNWVRDTGEMCDDWDRTDWDWCNASCNVEPGRNCVWSPALCINAIGSGNDGDTLVIASWQVVTSNKIRNLGTQILVSAPATFSDTINADKGVKFGNPTTTCSATIRWTVRYNTSSNTFQWCYNVAWTYTRKDIGAGMNVLCPAGTAIQSFDEDWTPVCVNWSQLSGWLAVACGADEAIQSFDINGNPVCIDAGDVFIAPPTSCWDNICSAWENENSCNQDCNKCPWQTATASSWSIGFYFAHTANSIAVYEYGSPTPNYTINFFSNYVQYPGHPKQQWSIYNTVDPNNPNGVMCWSPGYEQRDQPNLHSVCNEDRCIVNIYYVSESHYWCGGNSTLREENLLSYILFKNSYTWWFDESYSQIINYWTINWDERFCGANSWGWGWIIIPPLGP